MAGLGSYLETLGKQSASRLIADGGRIHFLEIIGQAPVFLLAVSQRLLSAFRSRSYSHRALPSSKPTTVLRILSAPLCLPLLFSARENSSLVKGSCD